jgi:hypothetical protein
MRDKRQKNQLVLAFPEEARSEAPNSPSEGIESPIAEHPAESPTTSEEDERLTNRTAVYGTVCTVVWEGGAAKSLPIPITSIMPSRGLCRVRLAHTDD